MCFTAFVIYIQLDKIIILNLLFLVKLNNLMVSNAFVDENTVFKLMFNAAK